MVRREDLTERQQELLDLLVEGLTQPQMAERLFLSTNTVKTHMRLLYKQLGVHSAQQAILATHEIRRK